MAFTPSKSKKHNTQLQGSLNMNSMMDMMTIILLFLLKSYSTTGALAAQSESLKLPVSTRDIKPKKELNVSVAQDVIMINEQPVMTIAEVPPNEILIPQLAKKLIGYANAEKQLEITKKTLRSAKQNYESTKERYTIGAANITEFLIASNQYVTSRLNSVTAVYNYFRVQKELLAAIGKL